MQMVVPEFEFVPKQVTAAGKAHRSLHMGRVVPIYPATSGLNQRELRSAVAIALKGILPELKDPLPEALLEKYDLLDFPKAMTHIHFPPTPEAVAKAQDRMTFEELLCFQLALGIRRRHLSAQKGMSHQTQGDLIDRLKANLPFVLTAGQQAAIDSIIKDMAASSPMRRLIQGEVGSGKTVVAAFAAVVAVQSGCQAVFMAPTEVLARQHALSLSQLLGPIDIQVGLITSSQDPKARTQVLEELRDGTVSVLVGTHAVLQPGVQFKNLGLVVIDEQQKFGVKQRNTIVSKGENPDLLILTATPIPRTLALTLYGEMETSAIVERPAGRQPVRTLWMDSSRRDEAYGFVRSELDAGRQGYVVCPRIGKEEVNIRVPDDLFQANFSGPRGNWATATDMFEEYQKTFTGYPVALLHGQMKSDEQRAIFKAFKEKKIQLLVATQVIEVGVDVANATVMVIEGADRFGLSQLHQLRGRVGRGKHDSICILMADPKHPTSVERLETLVNTDDAFKIAEEDLRLRGPGELLGKRQAGLPDLKCLSYASQGPWLEVTKQEAEKILAEDPELEQAALGMLKQEMNVRFPKLTEPAS